MSFCKVYSGAVSGISASLVNVEVNIDFRGFPSFSIVGLPAKEIEESKERVRSAIKNAGIHFPDGRITINLAPADINKKGSLYDLPIAVGILAAAGKINEEISNYFIFGELSLDGGINYVKGGIPLIEIAEKYCSFVLLPKANSSDSTFFNEIRIKPVEHLKQVISYLNGTENIDDYKDSINLPIHNIDLKNFRNIKRQIHAKKGLLISAAGRHNIAFSGPPGTGKSMLSRSLIDLLPPLNIKEIFEISKIYSASEEFPIVHITDLKRPFRSPHHTISRIGLIGGGNPIRLGEITLAHNGVLFLDEITEFDRECIDALRQPIENKSITINRASGVLSFPSDFLLVTSYNLCPCGFYGHPNKKCTCSLQQIKKYLSKISGPIIDRIDLHVFCQPVEIKELTAEVDQVDNDSLNVDDIAKSLLAATKLQFRRYDGNTLYFNSNATLKDIELKFRITTDANKFLQKVSQTEIPSTRSFYKTLKVARTIADLDGNEDLEQKYIAEALQYKATTAV